MATVYGFRHVQQNNFGKTRSMLRKNIFFAITAAILDLENRYYFLNISVNDCYHTDWIHEHRIVHFGAADTHSYMLEISKNTQVSCHLAAILDLCDIFSLKHTYFLHRRSLCDVNTLDVIKYNNCVLVFILKSKISDLVIYWSPFWIPAAILNSCLNKIIINRLSDIDVIYFSEKIILLY